jgi:hypothetical protein
MPLVLGERKFITLLATERPLEVEYLALPLRWSGRDKPKVLNMIKVASIVCRQRSIETQRRRSDPRVLGAQCRFDNLAAPSPGSVQRAKSVNVKFNVLGQRLTERLEVAHDNGTVNSDEEQSAGR